MSNDKMVRQLALEDLSSQLGVVRYQQERPLPWRDEKGARKEECDLPPGKKMLDRVVQSAAFEAAIEAFLEGAASGKAGRRHASVRYLIQFEPAVLAYAATRRLINAAVKEESLVAACVGVAQLLEEDFRFKALKGMDKDSFASAVRKTEKISNARHRRNVLRRILSLKDVKGPEWCEKDKLRVGEKLLELFIQSTGLVAIHEERLSRTKSRTVVQATPALQEWLEKEHGRSALMAPVLLPMIVTPTPWSNPVDGGYLTTSPGRDRLIRTRNAGYVDELFSSEMPALYEAVNAVQETAWRINRGVHAVFNELFQSGSDIADLPGKNPDPLPLRDPALDGMTYADEPVRKWRQAAKTVYARNAKRLNQRIAMAQQAWVANEFLEEEEIFFPHSLDFRGRLYPMPTGDTPQADDVGKALLEFAHGLPLGESGVFWLAVHIANLFGMDKLPLDERAQWTQDNEDMILDSGLRPLDGQRGWTTADSPWQALAGCIEWAGYRMMGPDYVSHLPVALDGSCSGLQHFSALLLDPSGGKVVNLVPGEQYSDIYTQVAAEVQLRIDSSTNGGKNPDAKWAAFWMSRNGESMVTRKLAKHPCMTYAYSATVSGMRKMVLKQLDKEDGAVAGSYLGTTGNEAYHAAHYLAKMLFETIGDLVLSASVAMTWLRKVAAVVSDADLPLRWVTPTGLSVLQENKAWVTEKANLFFAGQRVRVSLRSDGKEIDKQDQLQSISPNYIHSMDSAHLMATVNAARAAGIQSFAMIHDSFGTHAANAEALGAILRETFIEQYTPDLLTKFYEEVRDQLTPEEFEKIPPPPTRGSLDLTGVRESSFFFS